MRCVETFSSWRLIVASAVFLLSVLGAFASVLIPDGFGNSRAFGITLYWLISISSAALWIVVARRAEQLASASLTWVILSELGYLAGYLALGERLTGQQWIGAAIALLAILLLQR